MTEFRITLELASAIGTPLAADTLWGHIAWGIRHREGNSFLEDWLARYDQDHPPLILSDPLPAGRFPRPCLPQPPRPPRKPPRETMLAFKQGKKIDSISREGWQVLQAGVSAEKLAEVLTRETPPRKREATVTHAGVNRLTGGTANQDGGTLYTTRQTAYLPGTRFEVWGRSPESLETVQQWFAWGLEGGYGRDAATGLGHLKLVDVSDQETLPQISQPNAMMLLGPCIPSPGDPTQGFFQTLMKSGRVGGNFAIGALPDGVTQRQKFPVTLLTAGTILLTPQPPPALGRVIAGVHRWSGIRQYGITPVLPIRLDDSLLEHSLLQPRIRKEVQA